MLSALRKNSREGPCPENLFVSSIEETLLLRSCYFLLMLSGLQYTLIQEVGIIRSLRSKVLLWD